MPYMMLRTYFNPFRMSRFSISWAETVERSDLS